jgi:hypothetical protein
VGKKIGKTKQPYCFEVNEGGLSAFKELWDRWKNTCGNKLRDLLDSDHDPEC